MLAFSYAMVLASSFTLTGCKQEPGTKAPSREYLFHAAGYEPDALEDDFPHLKPAALPA